jgi:NAD(P)-dependent dehydrogenase (short-subunit alcohol dehydrogenase family)
MSKVWFITGAGRGMGVDIAKAALAAGHAVVATGRNASAVSEAVGEARDLLVDKLDITSPKDAKAAVAAALERFGRIDVLVNNAGNFYAGFFEEITPEDFRAQVETNLFGPINVTRAMLPVMRAQRSGLVVTISSTAGISGQGFVSAYSASKFGLEGWMESLAPEVAPFGVRTMLVEPGFFRTELLTEESTNWPEPTIDDYAEKTKQTVVAWKGMNGLQGGDPAKLATALVKLASQDEPPLRWAPALTPSKLSSKKPGSCSPRPTRIGSCHRRLDTTTRTLDARTESWNTFATFASSPILITASQLWQTALSKTAVELRSAICMSRCSIRWTSNANAASPSRATA